MNKELPALDTALDRIPKHIQGILDKPLSRRGFLKAAGAVGAAGLLAACGPDTPTQTEKTVSPEMPAAGIFAMDFPLSEIPLGIQTQFAEKTQVEMERLTGIMAIDPKNPENTATFYFVSTTEEEKNYVMFSAPNNYVISNITAATVVDPSTQQVSFSYLEDRGNPFLGLQLDKYLPRESGETDQKYKERVLGLMATDSFREEIRAKANDPRSIEAVTVANPYAGESVTMSTKDKALQDNPSFFEQFMSAMSPAVAYAEELAPTVEPKIPPTTAPTVSPSPTVEASPTVAPTSTPEATVTPEPSPTPESPLELTPTSLTPERASKYIAGGEYADLSQFEGRVFEVAYHEEALKGKAAVILSPEVYETMKLSLSATGTSAILKSEWGTILQKTPELYTMLARFYLNTVPAFILSTDGNKKPIVYAVYGEDSLVNKEYPNCYVGHVGELKENGEVQFTQIPLYGFDTKKPDPFEMQNALDTTDVRFHDETGKLITDDGYQIRATLPQQKNEKGVYEWIPILPHERRDGRAEFLTPEQKIDVVVKRLGVILGLKNPDGSVNPNSYITLPNSKGEPSMILVKGGEGGSPCGLSPELGYVADLQTAVTRLNEIDPTIVDTITRGFGLKAVTYELVPPSVFIEGRENFDGSYTVDKGIVHLNQKKGKSPGQTVLMYDILIESRAIGFLSNRIGVKLDDDVGIEKGLFIKQWCEDNKNKLTVEEYDLMVYYADYNIKTYS